ncbi:hypothetical protein BaRGS_00030019 [Batillaria attramentaria]|uniref:Uncharacterized protein n=1 Tax=Batillaria attramentaria TaxID=370345 RepID=A0ABD0JUD7_9CAEN
MGGMVEVAGKVRIGAGKGGGTGGGVGKWRHSLRAKTTTLQTFRFGATARAVWITELLGTNYSFTRHKLSAQQGHTVYRSLPVKNRHQSHQY